MISCEAFRAQFAAATEDPALLEHVRVCDSCLAAAAEIDPDILFRALGGAEMIPPGGLEPFVADVMRAVQLRSTENVVVAERRFGWTRGLAAAATLALAIAGGTYVVRYERSANAPLPGAVVQRAPIAAAVEAPVTRPVVESYDSNQATIVEMPVEGAGDVQVVMVFDETLPADL